MFSWATRSPLQKHDILDSDKSWSFFPNDDFAVMNKQHISHWFSLCLLLVKELFFKKGEKKKSAQAVF